MSRKIDASDLDQLDEEDLKYLHDRGLITTKQLAEHLDVSVHDVEAALTAAGGSTGVPLSEIAHTGNANTAGLSKEELEAQIADRRGGQSTEDDGPYAGMSNNALRAEIVRRNEGRQIEDKLSLDGRKDDLVATLVADDESESE